MSFVSVLWFALVCVCFYALGWRQSAWWGLIFQTARGSYIPATRRRAFLGRLYLVGFREIGCQETDARRGFCFPWTVWEASCNDVRLFWSPDMGAFSSGSTSDRDMPWCRSICWAQSSAFIIHSEIDDLLCSSFDDAAQPRLVRSVSCRSSSCAAPISSCCAVRWPSSSSPRTSWGHLLHLPYPCEGFML